MLQTPRDAPRDGGVERVAVGAEFRQAKVVKTTTFGAFIELTEGVEGLLHISDVAPGRRPATVEEVFRTGDNVDVVVVAVDDKRGRIGLRLADDPAVAGKSKDELADLPRPVAVGADRQAKVVKTTTFGAFIEFPKASRASCTSPMSRPVGGPPLSRRSSGRATMSMWSSSQSTTSAGG